MTGLMPQPQPVRVVHVGAGAMGREWLKVESASPEVEVVGIVDFDLDAARAGAALGAGPDVLVGRDLGAVLRETSPDALIDVTVPQAHHSVTMEALFSGVPVLGEKPAAATVAEGLSLAAASEVTGKLFMVSQSRRYNPHVSAVRGAISALGGAGLVTCEFFRAPRFGGFREEMDDVLLLDMAIHPFDMVRYLLGKDPVSVYCDSFNPTWSWYRGNAAASAIFDFADGTRFVYTGSWCSPGAETSWNGSWRISAERGTVRWDGDDVPEVDVTVADDPGRSALAPVLDGTTECHPESIAGALAAFVAALRGSPTPHGEIHENLGSAVMVEAAVRSNRTGARVVLGDVLEEALSTAIEAENRDAVCERLRSWASTGTALYGEHPTLVAGEAARGPER